MPGLRTGVAPGTVEIEVRSLVRSEINRQVQTKEDGIINSSFSEPDHTGRWNKYLNNE